jgi:hypothetical protein
MVLMTTGYALFGDAAEYAAYLDEPTVLLEANQLAVEHRYFGTSIADDADWSFLTVAQAAADSHRIVELLSTIYTGPWVGTGASKGGMTAIFHHRYYPRDLAAVIPYVAPISFAIDDPRYLDWVDQIGPSDGVCRERVKDMAVEAIERRRESAQHFIDTDPRGASISRDVLEALATYPSYGFHWSFWQFWASAAVCDQLPVRGKPIDQLAAWFPIDLSYLQPGDDFDPEVTPYYYQARRELGWQAIDYDYLADAAADVDFSVLPTFESPPRPWGANPVFVGETMLDVDRFLREDARHVLAIYGKWDAWTGGAITVDTTNDSTVVLVPGANHSAMIADLPDDQQAAIIARINGWLGRSSLVAGRGPPAPPPPRASRRPCAPRGGRPAR